MSNYNTQLQSNNTDLQTVLQTLQTKAAGGEQATPVISVNSSGLITAIAGAKTSTHQLAFQPSQTITPSTASQIAVSSGYYTGGNVTVAAIPSTYVQPSGTKTITENGTHDVKSYESVSVSVANSGGDTSSEDGLVARNITSYTNDRVTTIGNYAFYSCSRLTTASFPAVTTIASSAFYNCTSLTTVSFPAATTISNYAFYSCFNLTTVSFPAATTIRSYAFANCTGLTIVSFPAATTISNYAFANCTGLTTVSFPAATTIGSYAFHKCYSLTTVSFPAATTISSYAFANCSNLKSLYLTGSRVCTLLHSGVFSSTPIGGYSVSAGTYGSIYVPASLLTSYKAATNWTYFSSRFVGI